MECEKICPICRLKATHKCSACENVYYCSKEHQRKHWKKHAEVCRTFKLVEDSRLGRHYIASRNIKVREVILKNDQPLVMGPMHNTVPVCLNCYAVLSAITAVPCAKCGWPLCQNCKEHGPECDFTSARRDDKVHISDYGYPHPSYQCINVIRGLSLKDTNPAAYQKLLSFESHCDLIQSKEDFVFAEPLNVVRFIKRFFKVDDIPDEEIIKIVGILQVNGHEVPITEPPCMAVYEFASFFEHACRANCSKSFTADSKLIIHAAVPITKGDHLSICYTDPLWGVVNRRYHLSRTKFFSCTCDRCEDPTEFGTMFNALKCTEANCSGYILPKTFLSESPMEYVCNICESKKPSEEVEEILDTVGMDLSKMKKNSVVSCKEFLSRHKNILHENHFYNTDVNVALAQLIGQQIGGLQIIDDDLLTLKIELCTKLNNLLSILTPAENRIRGLILFEMHVSYAEYSRRHKEDAVNLLMKSRNCLLEARQLLLYEPEVLPEGKIRLRAEKNLQDMKSLLKTLNLRSA